MYILRLDIMPQYSLYYSVSHELLHSKKSAYRFSTVSEADAMAERFFKAGIRHYRILPCKEN